MKISIIGKKFTMTTKKGSEYIYRRVTPTGVIKIDGELFYLMREEGKDGLAKVKKAEFDKIFIPQADKTVLPKSHKGDPALRLQYR